VARTIMLPNDSRTRPGTCRKQTAGDWLAREMEQRQISNTILFARMRRAGYSATASNIVSQWRSGDTAISLKTLPFLLGALGMDGDEQRLWARHFICAELPELWPLLEEAA
jgi:hypothetical protein